MSSEKALIGKVAKASDVNNQPTDLTGTITHVHEFLGSTKLAEECDDRHNHRFAGVTSEVIPLANGSHIHGLFVNTDFFEDHHHQIAAVTGTPIPVGDDKHIHFLETVTTVAEDHFHDLDMTTLIQNPLV